MPFGQENLCLSSQKQLGISLQAVSTVIERCHCSRLHLGRAWGAHTLFANARVRISPFLVYPGAPILPQVRKKKSFHEMKGDRGGKSVKTSAIRNCLMQSYVSPSLCRF